MNAKELETAIDDMKSICAEGKKEVKKLLEIALGIKFAPKTEHKPGQVWKCGGGIFFVDGEDQARWIHPSSIGISMYKASELISNGAKLVCDNLLKYLEAFRF